LFKAFTILELLVVLIISSIIVGIGASCYVIAERSIVQYVTVNKSISNVFLFNSIFNNDINRSDVLLKTDGGIKMIGSNFSETEYFILNKKMIRLSGDVRDTFDCNFENVDYLFEQSLVQNSNNIVDEIIFNAVVFNEKEIFHYAKEYDRLTLMINQEKK
jgi:prepilin-type N-terminal cleavage/methylation domain-containing protein